MQLDWLECDIKLSYNPTLLGSAERYARECQRAIAWPTDAFSEKPLSSREDARGIASRTPKRKIASGVPYPASGVSNKDDK